MQTESSEAARILVVDDERAVREILAEFLTLEGFSVHTVEAALTSIYRKLDVHSRTEMAQKLAIAGD